MLQRAGIALAETKQIMVWRRLQSRLQALGLDNFDDYRRRLESDEEEVTQCVNAITTNVTAFFREAQHFDFLAHHLPELVARQPRVRLWSAGCSTGEEPYSMAMVVAECLADSGPDVRILATDINTRAVAQARQGVYALDEVAGLSPERLRRHCLRGRGPNQGRLRIRPEIAARVRFECQNLQAEWPMKGPFDCIFCRNVAIYFSRPVQRQLLSRFAAILRSGGHLMLGHSESIIQNSDLFQWCGGTIYRRR